MSRKLEQLIPRGQVPVKTIHITSRADEAKYSPYIVGIDLGTSNSTVAVYMHGHTQVIEIDGHITCPSVVRMLPDGRMLVGRAAKAGIQVDPDNCVASVKRHLGNDTEETWRLSQGVSRPERRPVSPGRSDRGNFDRTGDRRTAKRTIRLARHAPLCGDLRPRQFHQPATGSDERSSQARRPGGALFIGRTHGRCYLLWQRTQPQPDHPDL